ncbi:unnamed protein product [marine sediment metagenome]|uniref:Uncharacterized protein n=1 Tax=marine sediment metagenome TaxID=412755 RepID=X0X774_9ZZZZ
MNNTLRNRIWDILWKLSVDYDQIDNYTTQWIKGQYYLHCLNYDRREVTLEDVLNMIMEEIKSEY